MVEDQLLNRGIRATGVIAAMTKVPRHLFVPEDLRDRAYDDCPLPLGPDQTVSQPYIVALMLEKAEIDSRDKVLEVGTGSGYEAALLAELAKEVFSVEIDPQLLMRAQRVLSHTGYGRVHCRAGDGFQGWPEEAPFDVILISAAPDEIPRELVRQLRIGGRMILPIGADDQELVLIRKTESGLEETPLGGVRFVRMRNNS
jgi:protein-L-isoaspartate(D-aspartate) O-methyltransferase